MRCFDCFHRTAHVRARGLTWDLVNLLKLTLLLNVRIAAALLVTETAIHFEDANFGVIDARS